MIVKLNIDAFLEYSKEKNTKAIFVEDIIETYEDKAVKIDMDEFITDGKYKVYNFDGFAIREDCLIILGAKVQFLHGGGDEIEIAL